MDERRPVRARARAAGDEEEYHRYDDPADEGNDGEVENGRPPRRGRSGDARERTRPPARARDDRSLTAGKAAKLGLQQIAELTGKPTEGVTWVDGTDDEGWTVGVEVVEDRRIPSAADMLAIYETEMDSGGEMLSYRRVRRYTRGRGDEGHGGSMR